MQKDFGTGGMVRGVGIGEKGGEGLWSRGGGEWVVAFGGCVQSWSEELRGRQMGRSRD